MREISQKSYSVGIGLPKKVFQELDHERGLLTRSKYIQRILLTRETGEEVNKKILEDYKAHRKSWSKFRPLEERMQQRSATIPKDLANELDKERGNVPFCTYIRGLILRRNVEKAMPKFPEIDKEFLIWLAGFFDGEGSVGIDITKDESDKFGIHLASTISITNTNEEAMQNINEKLGFSFLYDEKNWASYYVDNSSGTRKPCYRIVIQGPFKTQLFIGLLKDYVKIKKPHFEILTDLNKLMRKKQRWTKESFTEALKLTIKINDLNRAVHRKHDARKILENLQELRSKS